MQTVVRPYELLERTELKDNTFTCFHKFQNEVVILRLVRSSGSVVDPVQAKYTLWNRTWNCSVSPIRQGGEIYFIVTNTESYSLLRQNEEVWKYGNRPEPPRAATSVEIDERRAIQQARSQGVEVPSPVIGTSENIIGMDVDPTEWDPELFIPCQGLFLPRDCATVGGKRALVSVERARTYLKQNVRQIARREWQRPWRRSDIDFPIESLVCHQPQKLALKLDSSSLIDIPAPLAYPSSPTIIMHPGPPILPSALSKLIESLQNTVPTRRRPYRVNKEDLREWIYGRGMWFSAAPTMTSRPKYRCQLIFVEQVLIKVILWAVIWGWGTTFVGVGSSGRWDIELYPGSLGRRVLTYRQQPYIPGRIYTAIEESMPRASDREGVDNNVLLSCCEMYGGEGIQ
ncbi:hypothetical protein PILCRDRAFT_90092 [Piloderma croceum F 1598]|uniref:Uncharacterized protein n=1 Tax=Piloderma croceum (strain F 1598) TaxID=765440 RepID=A0A0C3FI19_PILCF|nr:hypothetical protein PILCRDRAFT_90092 [Piloderma croceum F 1598]